jgi:hypothetical protein
MQTNPESSIENDSKSKIKNLKSKIKNQIGWGRINKVDRQ